MKLLVVAIMKICTAAHGLYDDEAIYTCWDKYVNCSINQKVIASKNPEVAAVNELKKCKNRN